MPQPPLADLESELKRDPRSRRFYDLAREYQKQGRFEEARDLCEKGLAVHPSQWQARILLAQIYVTQGKLDEGRQMVEKVLLALHDSVPANHLAADIYNALGQREKALRHYQIVELLEPGRAGVREHLQELQEPPPAAERPPLPPEALPSPQAALQPLEEPPAVLPPRAREAEPEPPAPPPTHLSLAPLPAEAPSAHSVLPEETFSADSEFPPEDDVEGASFAEILEPHAEEGGMDLMGPDVQLPEVEGMPTALEPSDTEEQPVPEEEDIPRQDEAAPVAGMSTFTLAELYEKQGYPEKAVEIYQRMLLRDPENAEVHGRITALKHRIAGEVPEAPVVHQEDVEKALRQKRVMALQGWLRRVREDRHV